MKKKDSMVEGSGNVFADLGFANPEQEQLKAHLTLQIFRTLKKRGSGFDWGPDSSRYLTHVEKRLPSPDPAELSDLLNILHGPKAKSASRLPLSRQGVWLTRTAGSGFSSILECSVYTQFGVWFAILCATIVAI